MNGYDGKWFWLPRVSVGCRVIELVQRHVDLLLPVQQLDKLFLKLSLLGSSMTVFR